MSCGVSLHPVLRVTCFLFPLDARRLAARTLIASALFLALGGLSALLMRLHLAYPAAKTISPETYNAAFTLHGTVMIFLAIIPALTGGFTTLLLPRWLSRPAEALPLAPLYLAAYLLFIVAGVILLAGTFLSSPAAAGWTSYPPLSSIPDAFRSSYFSGQAAWFITLALIAIAGILLAIAHVQAITSAVRAGTTWRSMPVPAFAALANCILLLFAGPVLVVAMAMNLTDLAGITSFFRPANWLVSSQFLPSASAGSPLLHQHLFWFYAHPAVYIMILPVFGIVTDIIESHCRSHVVARTGMIVALMAIGLLGFLVWAHHMFQTGLNPTAGTVFAIATVAIAIPSITKVLGWLATLGLRSWKLTPAMLAVVLFISLFTVGGLSGVMLALPAINAHLHDSYFVVAHLHYVLFGGSLFGIFAATYAYLPRVAESRTLRRLAHTHLLLSFLAFNAAFGPMHVLGAMGMPRRVAEYTQYTTLPKSVVTMNKAITHSAFLLGAAQLLYFGLAATAMFNPRRSSSVERAETQR